MTVRMPKPPSAARILRHALTEDGLSITHAQALNLVAKLYGYNSWYAMRQSSTAAERLPLSPSDSQPVRLTRSEAKKGAQFLVGDILVTALATDTSLHVELSSATHPGQRPLASADALFEAAAKDCSKPDPKMLFFGCKLPQAITGVDLRRKGESVEEFDRIRARHDYDGYLRWLEENMPDNDHDLSETAIFMLQPPFDEISGAELTEAHLEKDGKFTLTDGRQLYLLDENGERWKPLYRV